MRIDDILEQIQAIISGLEDSIYNKIGKVEGDIIELTQGMNSVIEDGEIANSA